MNIFVKSLMNHYNIITFDIFDTLIERSVSEPKDIFRFVGYDILGEEKMDSFLLDRISAEKRAREKRHDAEVTLKEIYDELKSIYNDNTEALMQDEIERELTSCHPKQKNVEWMQWCIKNNKKVFLISDMYLSPEIITEMLNRCGIQGYQKLYISNIYRRNKIKGDLFRVVIEENGLRASEILHVGDSLRADVLGAWKANVFALWLPRKLNTYLK